MRPCSRRNRRRAACSPNRRPRSRLTYSERIEPRFAVISVTDADGKQVTAGSPARAADDEDAHRRAGAQLPQGWYLVWWRVISADGHPVRGAFTFAVGPSPGPPPQFVIPSLGESAATTSLVTSRWVLLLGMLAAIGLVAFRAVIARPLQVRGRQRARTARRHDRGRRRARRRARGGARLPRPRDGRVLAATLERPRPDRAARARLRLRPRLQRPLGGARAVRRRGRRRARARPARPRRGAAARRCSRLMGAGACAAAALVLPGSRGTPATTSPVGLMLALDWLHLAAASIWIGGLAGLLVLAAATRAGRRVARAGRRRPALLARGHGQRRRAARDGRSIASIVHLPTLGALWQTSYGLALIAKSVLLALALVLGARQQPALAPAARRRGGAARRGARRRRGAPAAPARAAARARCSPAPCSPPRS